MGNKNDFEELKKKIIKILKENGIKKAGIFGSFARGEQNEKSDIDILIEFQGGLIGLIKIERELENNLGIKVDLLTYEGISPYLRDEIFSNEVRII